MQYQNIQGHNSQQYIELKMIDVKIINNTDKRVL
jgi:hypothetical protein